MGPLSDLPASEHTSFCFSTRPSLPRRPWLRRSERAFAMPPGSDASPACPTPLPAGGVPLAAPPGCPAVASPRRRLSLRALAASLRSLRSWAACGAGAPPPALALSCQFPSDSRTQAWLSFLPLRASHSNQQISKNSEVKSKEDRGAAWPPPEEGTRGRRRPGGAGRERPGGRSRASLYLPD